MTKKTMSSMRKKKSIYSRANDAKNAHKNEYDSDLNKHVIFFKPYFQNTSSTYDEMVKEKYGKLYFLKL